MVTAQITNGMLELRVHGLHKLLAFRNSIQIPLASIELIRADAARARVGPEGTRNPGTGIPGVITAGTYNSGMKRTFWDVQNSDKAIFIKLKNVQDFAAQTEDRYDELMVEVEDPTETVDQINGALFKGEAPDRYAQ